MPLSALVKRLALLNVNEREQQLAALPPTARHQIEREVLRQAGRAPAESDFENVLHTVSEDRVTMDAFRKAQAGLLSPSVTAVVLDFVGRTDA